MRSPLDADAAFGGVYRDRTVLVTGDTGFKGGWLCLWLVGLGARVVGYSLDPPTSPSLYDAIGLGELVEHVHGDVRDVDRLRATFATYSPEVVFHLAAQSLVRTSYARPIETYETNVMGTVNLLEAVRGCSAVKAVVNVTSDKCYENREWEYAYRENDSLGGSDPYSSSKACAELVTSAYRESFFGQTTPVAVASVRGGNVIGGGDWAIDRLIPDCVRALSEGELVTIRNPEAVRPWQYVLEPLAGYLWLGSRMCSHAREYTGAWNFGPSALSNVRVEEVVEGFVAEWGGGRWKTADPHAMKLHEATFLKLDCTKAADLLGWRCIWSLRHTVATAARWYKAHYSGGADLLARSQAEIAAYTDVAHKAGLAWTAGRADVAE